MRHTEDIGSSARRLLRVLAGTLALAAGLLHLTQIEVHTEEDPLFGAFFLVVGTLQLAGAAYLLIWPGPQRLRYTVLYFGIIGSLLTFGVWAVDRIYGLPFGAEPGAPETVGLADATAGLFELFTALALYLLVSRGLARPWLVGAAGVALVLAGAWIFTRRVGLFDPDPRLTARPDLTDATAVAFLILVALLFAALARDPRAVPRVGSFAFLVALFVLEISLVVFTVPTRAGQNRDCAYAPLREDTQARHGRIDPVRLAVGESTRRSALVLVNCIDAPVTIEGIELIYHDIPGLAASAAEVRGMQIERSPSSRAAGAPSRGGGEPVAGFQLAPGAAVAVVIEVLGRGDGSFYPQAFAVSYHAKGQSSVIGFAGFTSFCVGNGPCPGRVGH